MQRQHSVHVALQCNIMDRITETQTRHTPCLSLYWGIVESRLHAASRRSSPVGYENCRKHLENTCRVVNCLY